MLIKKEELYNWTFSVAGPYNASQGTAIAVNSAGTGKPYRYKGFSYNGMPLPCSGYLSVIGSPGANDVDNQYFLGWYWLGTAAGPVPSTLTMGIVCILGQPELVSALVTIDKWVFLFVALRNNPSQSLFFPSHFPSKSTNTGRWSLKPPSYCRP
jgi:hypothetical protein